jgi:hypothetical protein
VLQQVKARAVSTTAFRPGNLLLAHILARPVNDDLLRRTPMQHMHALELHQVADRLPSNETTQQGSFASNIDLRSTNGLRDRNGEGEALLRSWVER